MHAGCIIILTRKRQNNCIKKLKKKKKFKFSSRVVDTEATYQTEGHTPDRPPPLLTKWPNIHTPHFSPREKTQCNYGRCIGEKSLRMLRIYAFVTFAKKQPFCGRPDPNAGHAAISTHSGNSTVLYQELCCSQAKFRRRLPQFLEKDGPGTSSRLLGMV